MSAACKCDKCGAFFLPAIGTVSIADYHITTQVEKDGTRYAQGWQADLCGECSEKFLDFINHNESPVRKAEATIVK